MCIILYQWRNVCFLLVNISSMFGASDFKRLVSHVDGFSLMTYDYSGPGRYIVHNLYFIMRTSVLVFKQYCSQVKQSSSLYAYFFLSDYPSPCSPGANSPIDWMEECVVSLSPELSPERAKILLGLNFYGYDFSTSNMEGTCMFAV